jgi:3-hydroxybutyryl-CoA dehydrogenase
MDMFGNDSNVVAFRTLYEQLHDEKFAPPPLLIKMVEAGHYGRKVGHGWYTYDEQGKQIGPTKMY